MKEKDTNKTINVKLYRYDPTNDDEPYYESYKVTVEPPDPEKGTKTTVLDVLKYVKGHYDGFLSFYASCLIPFWEARKQDRCSRAICNVLVNGKPVLTCEEPVTGEEDLVIEPPSVDPRLGFKVIKDLIAEDVMLDEKDYYFIAQKKTYGFLNELEI